MENTNYTLGFIGIGLMGQPMSLRLVDAGFKINVWNRTSKKMKQVISAGATPSNSIADLVRNSDIIILSLADTLVVENIVCNHIIPNGTAGKLLIDLSSIHPEATRRLAVRLEQSCSMGWVDAPVSGGVSGAENGTLAIMAGGKPDDLDIARRVLSPLYSQLTHMGDIGSGQITKICNQMIVSCNVMVIAEMMALAKKAGVASDKIPLALAGGFADSKPLQIVGPEMAANQFEPIKWRIKTLLKDLEMALDISSEIGNAVPMSGLATQLMQLHASNGHREQDPATLIKLFERQ